MPILHIRGIPDELYETIKQRAAAERRSITAEVIELLEAGLDAPHEDESLDEVFERARLFRERLKARAVSFDSTQAIREDRER